MSERLRQAEAELAKARADLAEDIADLCGWIGCAGSTASTSGDGDREKRKGREARFSGSRENSLGKRLAGSISANPFPIALIAFGAGWLALARIRQRDRQPGQYRGCRW